MTGIPSIDYFYDRQCLKSLQKKILALRFVKRLLDFCGEIFDVD